MRIDRPSTSGAPPIAAAWSTTAIEAASIYRSNTPSALPRPGSSRRSAASVTAMTTPWPRQSMAFTRPRSFTGEDHGDPLKPSNTPRWNGSTGSTTGACWSPSETYRPPKPRNATTPCSTTDKRRHNLNQMASGDPGAVHDTSSSVSFSPTDSYSFPGGKFRGSGHSNPGVLIGLSVLTVGR